MSDTMPNLEDLTQRAIERLKHNADRIAALESQNAALRQAVQMLCDSIDQMTDRHLPGASELPPELPPDQPGYQ